MPHVVIEYTDNLRADADIAALLKKTNALLIEQRTDAGPVFPIGGIRSRAIALTEYGIADGGADDAFVHVTVKIGAGRDAATKKRAFDALFAMLEEHFADLYARRGLALSMEVVEFSEAGTWKHNNIHERFKAKGS
ncbi:MAG: 5-carboxymethyl-2-hydroxymuconate Delta-isomerase [Burkholderiaceae bacterium]